MFYGINEMPYKVMNSRGGTLGAYKSMEAAQRAVEKFNNQYKNDKFGNSNMHAFVVECK